MLMKLLIFILKKTIRYQRRLFKRTFNRHVSVGDLLSNRWEIAEDYGFGDGSSCYDNVLILNDVQVGTNTWIGPFCVLDGTGKLKIGNYCSISSGVQIYTHDSVSWATSMGKDDYVKAPVTIGNGCYIGPNSIISKGVTIGDRVIIGSNSFVNKDVPSDSKAFGSPVVIKTNHSL